jgi:hypothetical protein
VPREANLGFRMLHIRITELEPNGARAAFGVPLPGSLFRVPLDAILDEAVVDDGSYVRVESVPQNGSSPLAPAALTRFVKAFLPRHARGQYATGDALERRTVVAGQVPAVDLPPRGVTEETCEARQVLENELRLLIESFALPPSVAVSVLKLGENAWPIDEVEALAVEVASDPDGALIEWDAAGAALDRALVEAAKQREASARLATVQAADDSRRNTDTCAQLNVCVVRVGRHAFENNASNWSPLFSRTTPPLYRDDRFSYFAFDRTSFAHLAVPSGPLAGYVGEVMPPDFIPQATRKELQEHTYSVDGTGLSFIATELRRGSYSVATVTAFRDMSTPEGIWAEELAEIICRPWMPLVASTLTGAFYRALVLNVLLRGVRLRPDCAWALYQRMALPLWTAQHAGRKVGGVEVPCPPLPLTEERFNDLARKIISGSAALVGVDELWEEPTEDAWTRLRNTFTRDTWRPVVERVMNGRPYIRSEEIEQALLAEKVIAKELSARDHGRLVRLMNRLGYVKTDVRDTGRKFKAFAPKAKP